MQLIDLKTVLLSKATSAKCLSRFIESKHLRYANVSSLHLSISVTKSACYYWHYIKKLERYYNPKEAPFVEQFVYRRGSPEKFESRIACGCCALPMRHATSQYYSIVLRINALITPRHKCNKIKILSIPSTCSLSSILLFNGKTYFPMTVAFKVILHPIMGSFTLFGSYYDNNFIEVIHRLS